MNTVLSITIPFFGIIFLGTFFRAKNIFDDNASKILTKFTFFVTLPPFIFVNIIRSSNINVKNFYKSIFYDEQDCLTYGKRLIPDD